jgi:hypothetical protein
MVISELLNPRLFPRLRQRLFSCVKLALSLPFMSDTEGHELRAERSPALDSVVASNGSHSGNYLYLF